MDAASATAQIKATLELHGFPLDQSALDVIDAWPDGITRAGVPRHELLATTEGETEHAIIVRRLKGAGPFLARAMNLRNREDIDAPILEALILVMDSGTRHCSGDDE